jgi:polyisoprenoid-binding protein YceI
VARFPQASFQSTAVKRLDANRFEVAGKLAIKGVSSDVVVPVTLAQQGAQTTATGSFAIKRLTFRIGEQEWSDTSMVADDVQVRFRFMLTGIAKL